ncbi:lysozyme inhibitor LprI family protein [Massilia aquatica]|nr:lysozyme inhibitor LprI family protein [Massilia aquatica]
MRTVSALVFMACFTAALVAIEATAAQPPAVATHAVAAQKCGEFSHTGGRQCFRKLLAESTVSLKKAEADALAKIAQWFENDRYKNVARTRMRAAGASFARYRAARCAYLAALHGDTRDISRLACLADMNAERVLELTRNTHDLPSDSELE